MGIIKSQFLIRSGGKARVVPNPLLRDHAIFIGYAPYDNPRYSIAVIVENGESGGRVAGPIAKEVLEELLNGF